MLKNIYLLCTWAFFTFVVFVFSVSWETQTFKHPQTYDFCPQTEKEKERNSSSYSVQRQMTGEYMGMYLLALAHSAANTNMSWKTEHSSPFYLSKHGYWPKALTLWMKLTASTNRKEGKQQIHFNFQCKTGYWAQWYWWGWLSLTNATFYLHSHFISHTLSLSNSYL